MNDDDMATNLLPGPVPINNEPPKRELRWSKEDAMEAGLPSPEAINYMVSVAKLVSGSVLFTPDLAGEIKGWPPNKPFPKEHYIPTEENKAPCPCELCDTRRVLADTVRANALAKMLFGWEHGVHPFASLATIFIVKGRMTMHYSNLLGIIQSKGWQIEYVQWDTKGCRLRATRGDQRLESFYGPEEAERAGLDQDFTDRQTGEVKQKSQYNLRPEVMYLSKCTGKLYRALGIAGPLLYTREEAYDIQEPVVPDQSKEERLRGAASAGQAADESIVPPEAETAIMAAAGQDQEWAYRKLQHIKATAKTRDEAKEMVLAAVAEAEQVRQERRAKSKGPLQAKPAADPQATPEPEPKPAAAKTPGKFPAVDLFS